MKAFLFERVLLVVRGCTFVLRGCSRIPKTPNSPPLLFKCFSILCAPITPPPQKKKQNKTKNKQTIGQAINERVHNTS